MASSWRQRGAPARMPAPRSERSEVVGGAQLHATRIAQQSGWRRVPAVVGEVLEVEHVEDVECHAHRALPNRREVLAQAQVDIAIRPGAGNDEGVLRRTEAARPPARRTEAAADVVARPAAERHEAAE